MGDISELKEMMATKEEASNSPNEKIEYLSIYILGPKQFDEKFKQYMLNRLARYLNTKGAVAKRVTFLYNSEEKDMEKMLQYIKSTIPDIQIKKQEPNFSKYKAAKAFEKRDYAATNRADHVFVFKRQNESDTLGQRRVRELVEDTMKVLLVKSVTDEDLKFTDQIDKIKEELDKIALNLWSQLMQGSNG